MKALVKDIDGIGLTLREVEKPTIQANEVLIKIKSTAICGTDLHIWNWDAWASSTCLLYTSPSPRDRVRSRMPSSA